MINLLPWREIERHRKITHIIYRLFFYILLATSIVFFIKMILQHKTTELTAEIKHIKDKSASIVLQDPHHHLLLLKKLRSVHALMKIAIQTNNTVENYLSIIVTNMPNDIVLTSLDFNSKRLKFTGFSNQLAEIHQYNASLQNQFNGKRVILTELHNDLQNQKQLYFTFRVII